MKKLALPHVMRFGLAVALFLSVGTNVASGTAAQNETELDRIEQAIRASIGWVQNKDLALLPSTIANDPEFLEVHPEGDVARFFCILDDINERKGKPAAAAYPVIFYSGRNDNKDVYILHPGEKEPRNLTNHPAQDLCPAASPDGNRILFLSDRGGNMDIYSMAVDGGDVRRLTDSPEAEIHPEYTPDGKRILFVRDFQARTEIWVMNADGSEARRLTNNEARDERPFLSPDGSKILFMSNRDGNYQIYTMAPDGGNQTRLVRTTDWDIFPVWSPDGKKIAYSRKFRADGQMKGMVRVMNADGTGDQAITGIDSRDENSMWSPDGRFILCQSVRDGNFEVYQVNADGSRPVRLTDHSAWDGWASYLPFGKK